jgi:hypothetical protein
LLRSTDRLEHELPRKSVGGFQQFDGRHFAHDNNNILKERCWLLQSASGKLSIPLPAYRKTPAKHTDKSHPEMSLIYPDLF